MDLEPIVQILIFGLFVGGLYGMAAVGLSLVLSRAFLAAAEERVDGRNWQPLGARTLRGRAQPVDLLGAHPFGMARRRTNRPESQLGSCAGDGCKMSAF